jgi:nucleotide-binding universal stress UspA family protein
MVGEPAERILDYAAKYRPTLIAMATHGRAGVERWIQGSVAESVLRASEQPVFLASQKALESPRRARIKRVLVPLDGSDRSAAALPQARKLAHRNGAELLLLHIVDIRSAASPSVGDAARTRLDAKHQLEAIVAEDSSVPTRIARSSARSSASAPTWSS